MAATKKIMAWSKCSIEIGKTAEGDAMASVLTSIGVIKDKSSSLEASEGDALEAKMTGGVTVAREPSEGSFTLTTRVIEPTTELLVLLGLAEASGGLGDVNVKTHVVAEDWSVKLTPKNVGARGIKAPKTSITYLPGWSEEEGRYADMTFTILQGEAGYWYSEFVKQAE